MRRVLVGLLALCLLLVLLVASAPARLLAWVLPPEHVLASGYTGSLWSGSVAWLQIATPAGPLHLGRVDWSLSPLSLLRLAPALTLDSHWGEQRISGHLRLHGGRDLTLSRVSARVDAGLLRQLAPLQLAGTLNLQLARLVLHDGQPQALEQGRLVWESARWNSPRGPIPLGSYVLEAAQVGDQTLRGEVLTLQGPVRAAGELQWSDGSYSIALRLDSEGAWDPLLQESLALLATPDGDGYRLQLSGRLAPPGPAR